MGTVDQRAKIRHRSVGPLAIAEAGEPRGTPLLLLHGIGSSSSGFADQLAVLGQTRWCIAVDAPGYAASDDDPSIASLDDYVGHYIRLLDALLVDLTDLLGVSWGGVIATRIALRHPSRVRRLVLADTSRGSGRDPEKAAAMRARSEILATEGPEQLARSRSHRLLSPNAPAELVERVSRSMASSIRLPGYGQAAVSMADTDHTEALALIETPTLVVVGALDMICPPAEAEQIASLHPRSRLVVIDGAGHLANQERPVEFNQQIDEFLQRKDPEMSTDAETGTDELNELMDSFMATRESRTEDWDTLAFQTKAGDQFRRAQVRYMGSGGTGRHEQDERIIQAENFTFSNMFLPPGAEGPEHNHHDAEEAFFVLEGTLEVRIHDLDDGTKSVARKLGYRDFIKIPAGVPRSLKNTGDTPALFCVMLGTGTPQIPTYPATSPMVGITRD